MCDITHTCLILMYTSDIYVVCDMTHTFISTHYTRLQHTATRCNTLQHCLLYMGDMKHTATHCSTLQHTATHCNTPQHASTCGNTGWRRLIGSPKLQIIFHKRAIKYRSLLRKMTCKDKGSYESSPPCTLQHGETYCEHDRKLS